MIHYHGLPITPATAAARDDRVDDLAALVRQLARSLSKAAPDHALPAKAVDYLRRKGLQGSPLRDESVKRDDVAGDAKDTARLNWLDEVNAKTNARYGTKYGWRFDLNHNRAALTDHNTPALPVREAIDAAIAARTKDSR